MGVEQPRGRRSKQITIMCLRVEMRSLICLRFSDLALLQDLAVRREGVFILRYRAFDIFSGVPGTQDAPILAELYGGPFKVYSTREFPGLEPSTELTKVSSSSGLLSC